MNSNFALLTTLTVLLSMATTILIKALIGSISPILFSGLLLLVTGLIFLPNAKIEKKHLKYLALLGLILATLRVLLFTSFTFLPAGFVEIVYDFPFSFVLAILFFNEKVTSKEVIGTLIAFTGIIIMFSNVELKNIAWILMPVGASFLGGLHANFAKKFHLKPKELLAGQSLLAGFLILSIYAFTHDISIIQVLPDLSTLFWAGFALLTLTYGAATIFFFDLINNHPVHKVAPFFLCIPVGVLVADVYLFDTSISLTQMIGIGIVFGGILLAERRSKKAKAPLYVHKKLHGK